MHCYGTNQSVQNTLNGRFSASILDACSFLIDELKAKVPIWKREVYEDGSAWKANVEAFKKQT